MGCYHCNSLVCYFFPPAQKEKDIISFPPISFLLLILSLNPLSGFLLRGATMWCFFLLAPLKFENIFVCFSCKGSEYTKQRKGRGSREAVLDKNTVWFNVPRGEKVPSKTAAESGQYCAVLNQNQAKMSFFIFFLKPQQVSLFNFLQISSAHFPKVFFS